MLIPLTLIVGSLASANTGTDIWYQGLIKSDLNPPGYVFGIVWPILYLLMGITAWRTFEIIKNLFYVQLFLNGIWSWLFFSFHLPLISLIDIWLLIYINITHDNYNTNEFDYNSFQNLVLILDLVTILITLYYFSFLYLIFLSKLK